MTGIVPPSPPIRTDSIDSITYTWSHTNESLVEFYRIVVGYKVDQVVLYLNGTEIVLPRVLNLAELRAVDICGQMSEPQHIEGMSSSHSVWGKICYSYGIRAQHT